jgi:ABC-type amino acid transport substrate-binding protein
LVGFSLTTTGRTETEGPPIDKVLRVGLHEVPPYALTTPSSEWSGLAVELWKKIAAANNWKYEFVPMPYENLIPALAARELDVVVGEFLVNPDDEQIIDFSQPYLTTTIGTAVSAQHFDPSWLSILLFAFDWTFLKLFLGLLPILILASLIVWHFERKKNPTQFGGRTAHGLGAAFWFITVTMTTTGYGDKAPITPLGRIVTIVWMFVSLFLMTAFTASVASTVATVRTHTRVASAADLQRFTNGVLHGTLAEKVLAEIGAPILLFEDLPPAFAALQEGKVQTVVADSTVLRFLIQQDPADDLQLLPIDLVSSRVAMALQQASPLREPLNISLLETIRSPAWQKTLQDYLGRDLAVQN